MPSSSSSSWSPSPPAALQWLSLIATIWLQTFNGANTDFPVYSSELKDLKRISQVGVNFLAFASDAGKIFGWFSGVAAMHLPLWLVAIVGAALSLAGYGFQFLFLDQPRFAYSHIFLLTALAGNGICWINTACYLICIKNFPSHSRVAVGLSTSYVGLSAKLYTVLAGAIFLRRSLTSRKAKQYLFLNAVVPALVALLVAPFLRLISARKNITRFDIGFAVMFVITFATGALAIVGSLASPSPWLSTRHCALSLGALLASPLVVPLAANFKEAVEETWWNKKENRVHDLAVDVEVGELAAEVPKEDNNNNDMVGEEEKLESSSEVGGLQILRKVNFWLYFFSYLFSATLGLVFLNNLGQIAESRGLEQEETSTLVSLSSSFGFFGRLLPFLLDYFCSKRKLMISRPASMAALMAPMAAAFFVLLNPGRLCLYVSTAVIGAFTGGITSIAVSATTELFGTKNFSVNHNIVVTNIPLGSFVFGYLAALLYQRGVVDGGHVCRGAACYELTFVVWGATCSLAAVLCTALYIRTRKIC